MIKHIAIIAAAASVFMAAPVPLYAAPPQVDYKDLGTYFRALKSSHDPAAADILAQIKNGPSDLKDELAEGTKQGIYVPPDTSNSKGVQKAAKTSKSTATLVPDDPDVAARQIKLIKSPDYKWIHLPDYARPLRATLPYTPEQITAVRSLLQDHDDVLDKIYDACSSDESSVNNLMTPSQYEPRLRSEAYILADASYLAARSGNYDEVVKDLHALLHLVKQTGSLLYNLKDTLSVDMEKVAANSFLDAHAYLGYDLAHLYMMQDRFPSFSTDLTTYRRLGEEYIRLAWNNIYDEKHPATTYVGSDGARHKMTPSTVAMSIKLGDAQTAYALHKLRKMYQLKMGADFGGHQYIQALEPEDQTENPIPAVFNAMIPAIKTIDAKYTAVEAREYLGIYANDVAQQIAKTGRVDNPPDASTKFFMDPYSGHPYHFVLYNDGGFLVYSVGPTGQFDGNATLEIAKQDQEAFYFPIKITQ